MEEGEKMADDIMTYGLHVEVGMLLEVLNESNEVLFRARVEEFDGDSTEFSTAYCDPHSQRLWHSH